jgi:hypothetical protein
VIVRPVVRQRQRIEKEKVFEWIKSKKLQKVSAIVAKIHRKFKRNETTGCNICEKLENG